MAIRFSAFIITFNRPVILRDTISALLSQSRPPDKILILDNGELPDSYLTDLFPNNDRLKYRRIGYNAGPAGAAALGLRMLANEGYDWIYWGDDNDPPPFPTMFSELLFAGETQNSKNWGVLGSVGNRISHKSGLAIRLSNDSIQGNGLINVDVVSGGQCLIIHRSVMERGIYPDGKLFFGFEELDFCLSVKAAGFRIGVDKSLFLRCRQHFNRMGLKETGPYKYPEAALWRQYYSTRNLLLIFRKHGLWSAWLFHLIRSGVKLFYNFRHGWVYGKISWRMVSAGLVDGLLGRSGFRQW